MTNCEFRDVKEAYDALNDLEKRRAAKMMERKELAKETQTLFENERIKITGANVYIKEFRERGKAINAKEKIHIGSLKGLKASRVKSRPFQKAGAGFLVLGLLLLWLTPPISAVFFVLGVFGLARFKITYKLGIQKRSGEDSCAEFKSKRECVEAAEAIKKAVVNG